MKKMLLLAIAASATMAVSASNVGVLRQTDNLIARGNAAATVVTPKAPVASVAKISTRLAKPVRPLAEGDLVASYRLPNMFYMGYLISEDGQTQGSYATAGVGNEFAHGPAYTLLPFVNTSTGATQYSWSYLDPTTFEDAASTDTDLYLQYEYSQLDAPVLTASNGTDTDTYSAAALLMYGGQSMMQFSDIGYAYFYDNPGNVALQEGGSSFGLGKRDGQAGYGSRIGIAYPAPYAPYAISQILVEAAVDFPAGTELTAEIYKLEVEGEQLVVSDEPLATATFIAQEDYTNSAGAGFVTTATLPFNVQIFDGLLYSDGFVTIDSAIAIMFDSNPSNVTTFDPIAFTSTDLAYVQNNAWMATDDEEGFGVGGVFTQQGASTTTYVNNFSIYTDATFGWFLPESDRVLSGDYEDYVTVATTGETITIPFNSYFIADLTTVQVWSEDGTVDWVDYTLENGEQSVDLTLTVDALPAGVSGRKCTLIFTPTGSAQYKLVIGQGTVGVESAVVTSAANVTVQGGNFVVSAPEAINNVTVYNVAGQAVATSEIAGTTTVDAQSLAKGVYVLRFNDGSTVKVIK